MGKKHIYTILRCTKIDVATKAYITTTFVATKEYITTTVATLISTCHLSRTSSKHVVKMFSY